MPINIYVQEKYKQIAWLCDTDWELPSQIDELEKWLIKNESNLTKGPYVADVGFSVRKGSRGGGGVVSLKMMKFMLKARMELLLSEYADDDVN